MNVDLASMVGSDEFAALTEPQRIRVRALMNCLAAMPEKLTVTGPGGVLDRLAAAGGFSRGTARLLYYRFRDSGRWQELVDERTRPASRLQDYGPRCPRFRAWVIKKVEENQRSTRMALKQVVELFLSGAVEIPGFEGHPGGFLPVGCSQTSLRALLKDVLCELTTIRQGEKSNAAHRLGTRTTREGLLPGQVYEFDDVWHDNLVLWPGQKEPVRVLEFGALDVASASRVSWGSMPHFRRENGHRQGLTQRLFTLFLANLLRFTGYAPGGCLLIMEHGTATISERVERILLGCGEGFAIRKGSITGISQGKLGGYSGNVGGNPRTKAHLESSHSGLHNLLAFLPGQVGKDRQHAQEATYGRLKEQALVDKWRERLLTAGRSDLAASLCNHFLTMHEFTDILAFMVRRWNNRTDHNLEGWARNTTLEYELTPNCWTPAALLTKGGTQPLPPMVADAVRSNPAMVRTRPLSPQEVWARGAGELRRLPLSVYVDILAECAENRKQARVYGGLMTVQDKLLRGREKLSYLAELYTPDGRRLPLGEDSRWQLVFNPYAPGSVVVLDEKGRIMGECPLYNRVRLDDTEALHEQMGRVAAHNARRAAQQRARWEDEAEQVRGLQSRNRAIAEEGGVAEVRELPPGNMPRAKKARRTLPAEPLQLACSTPARARREAQGDDAAAALAMLPSVSRRRPNLDDL